jgi:hypothetical protein
MDEVRRVPNSARPFHPDLASEYRPGAAVGPAVDSKGAAKPDHRVEGAIMTRWIASLSLLATLVLAGCLSQATAPTASHMPAPVAGNTGPVPLTINLSANAGSPGNPVVATATAANNGTAAVSYPDGCAAYTRIYFAVLDSDGRPVHLSDPTALPPMCPVGLHGMAPGGSISESLTFNGTLYHATGGSYAAPTGTYTIVANIWLFDGDAWSAPNQVLETRATLRWSTTPG